MKELSNDKISTVGVDVFIVKSDGLPIVEPAPSGFIQTLISNRGTKIWPGEKPNIEIVNVHRCRFIIDKNYPSVSSEKIRGLLADLESRGYEWVHVEKLLVINGKKAFSMAQGE